MVQVEGRQKGQRWDGDKISTLLSEKKSICIALCCECKKGTDCNDNILHHKYPLHLLYNFRVNKTRENSKRENFGSTRKLHGTKSSHQKFTSA